MKGRRPEARLSLCSSLPLEACNASAIAIAPVVGATPLIADVHRHRSLLSSPTQLHPIQLFWYIKSLNTCSFLFF